MSKRNAKVAVMAAAVLLAFGGQARLAHAGGDAQSILDVSNFIVTAPSNVLINAASNSGQVQATLNGTTASNTTPATPGPVTLIVCEPAIPGCPMHVSGTLIAPVPTDTFAFSSALLTGSAILPGGAHGQTDNTVEILGTGSALGQSSLGLVSNFTVTVVGAPATITFSELSRTDLLASIDAGQTGTATAQVAWSLSVTGAGTNFRFQPNGTLDAAGELADNCNQNTNVGVVGAGAQSDQFHCLGLFAASVTLAPGTYNATITHSGNAAISVVPAPGSLALMAGGLLGLGWFGRRSRKS